MGNYLVDVYVVYALLSVALTVWLARTLFKNGAVFLEEVFDEPRMAAAVNQLLVVGFYLVNLGYACLLLKADGRRQRHLRHRDAGGEVGYAAALTRGDALHQPLPGPPHSPAGARRHMPPPVAPQLNIKVA